MTIIEEKPLTLSEVYELIKDNEKSEEIKKFIKSFTKMPIEKALEIKEELKKANIIKLKDTHIAKIVDFLPKDAIELNKIIKDVSLDADETQKILDITKKY